MQQFGFEGRTLLYTLDGDPRFIGGTWGEAEAVLRRADVLLNFHYAIDPRLLACARRTALVDIDPGLLQFWMSTGQLDRKSTRLNSSHANISYAVFCLKKKTKTTKNTTNNIKQSKSSH